MKLFGAVCILSLTAAGAARADIAPACAAPAGVTEVAFGDVPAAIRKALAEQTGDMALPGQPFNVGDVAQSVNGKTLPFRRGLFAWNRGTRWVIATEHGGRGYNDPVYAFDAGGDGKRVKLVGSKTAFPKTVCAAAAALLDAQ